MRVVVILMLIAIVGSLFSALGFMFRTGPENRERMVRALTIRVGLSESLFLLLMASYYFGWIGARV